MALVVCPVALVSQLFSHDTIWPVGTPNKCPHILGLLVSYSATNNTATLDQGSLSAQSALRLGGHELAGKFHCACWLVQRLVCPASKTRPGTVVPVAL